ncbi:MAG: type II 3-dehydroquinate dehydratase [Desulfatiglandales bacterium]
MKKVLILHGVNLNMLGKRDPAQYGTATLTEINVEIGALAEELGLAIECFQTNHEGEFVEKIHGAQEEGVDAVIINAGAWTHYSYAIMDALGILEGPIIEVHMSHINAREPFRQQSVIAPLARGQISGFGVNSYLLGLRAAWELIKNK